MEYGDPPAEWRSSIYYNILITQQYLGITVMSMCCPKNPALPAACGQGELPAGGIFEAVDGIRAIRSDFLTCPS